MFATHTATKDIVVTATVAKCMADMAIIALVTITIATLAEGAIPIPLLLKTLLLSMLLLMELFQRVRLLSTFCQVFANDIVGRALMLKTLFLRVVLQESFC